MKQIYLIRHAKADDYYKYESDFERPLKERGKSDATLIAQRLFDAKIKPDLVITSGSKRTLETLEFMNSVFSGNFKVLVNNKLYLPTKEDIDQVITDLESDVKKIFIFTHNEGITNYANHKIVDFKIDNIPTSGVVGFDLAIDHFSENNLSLQGKLIYWDYPKNKFN